MATVTKTLVEVSTNAECATFVGDLDVETVKNMLLGAYPFLANSVFSEQILEIDGVVVKKIVAQERTATKGCHLVK